MYLLKNPKKPVCRPVPNSKDFISTLGPIFVKTSGMKKSLFKFLAKVNKAILPSYSKKRLDLTKASKFQMAIIGWRYYVTSNALG